MRLALSQTGVESPCPGSNFPPTNAVCGGSPVEFQAQAEMRKNDSTKTELDSFGVVAVGASAGGLEAFSQLLRAVPNNTGMAFVFVQHLDPTHHSMLSELLGKAANMPWWKRPMEPPSSRTMFM